MGQKVNPTGFRLGINKSWESCWFSKKDFSKNLNEDINIRNFVSKKYADASITRIELERAAKQILVKIFTAKPGKLIGKQGKGIESIKEQIKVVVKDLDKIVKVDILEIKNQDSRANLSAQSVAFQLEKRVSFRRAMKKVMQQAVKAGVKGVRIRVSGRLNGAEMARTEWYMEGRVPLHTLRADIDYGTAEALTTYGLIGVKVWLYKGEVFNKSALPIKHSRSLEE